MVLDALNTYRGRLVVPQDKANAEERLKTKYECHQGRSLTVQEAVLKRKREQESSTEDLENEAESNIESGMESDSSKESPPYDSNKVESERRSVSHLSSASSRI